MADIFIILELICNKGCDLYMKNEHKVLFKPFKIGNCEIKNRYVMVAMGTSGMVTTEGTFNERGVDYYIERAKGGVGLIITGTMYVENDIEKVLPGVMPIPTQNSNKFIITSSEMIERVHAYNCKIFAQLTAGFGRVISPHLLMDSPISSSETEFYWDENLKCRELTINEIHTIIEKCAESAFICQSAGYDGVEIHAVHEGYLLDQFAISYFNKRKDEYGGDLKGRLKFACDIVKCIKERCGNNFPVILRYSLKSFIKGKRKGGLPNENFIELGRDIEEGIEAARILTEAGYDCLDVDSGSYEAWYWAHPPMYFKKGMNITFGEIIKREINVPVIIAGRMENPDLASSAINSCEIDLIGLGRSLLADPYTVNKIKEERFEVIRPCIGCHEGCMNRLVSSKHMSCAVNPISGREGEMGLKPIYTKKKILVVGAGIAGMEAARVLKLRGHHVSIYEKESRAGGILKIYNSSGDKEDVKSLIDWYVRQLNEINVPIYYNTEVNESNIDHYKKDIIILATGSKPKQLNLSNSGEVINAEEVYVSKEFVNSNVGIIGGGLVGCELALILAKKNNKVYIFEELAEVLKDRNIPKMNKTMLIDLLEIYNVKSISNAKVLSYHNNKLKYVSNNVEFQLHLDHLINAIGYKSNDDLYQKLILKEKELYILGDAKQVKNIMYAIWDAYELANNL